MGTLASAVYFAFFGALVIIIGWYFYIGIGRNYRLLAWWRSTTWKLIGGYCFIGGVLCLWRAVEFLVFSGTKVLLVHQATGWLALLGFLAVIASIFIDFIRYRFRF